MLAEFYSTSKINLFLDVPGRDPVDGYHFINSIFYEIPWGDKIQIFSAHTDETLFLNNPQNLIAEKNTVSEALYLFKEQFGIKHSFKIIIEKKVPLGAGLGGGSGDAGAVLKFLCKHYGINIIECLSIAQKVGSDVPFFLYGGAALVQEKGEKIVPLDQVIDEQVQILVVTPNIHISTRNAFESLKNISKNLDNSKKIENFLKKQVWSLDFLEKNVYNIFELNIKELNERLDEFRYFLQQFNQNFMVMTGSGSSFVLFYSDKQILEKAVHSLKTIECNLLYFYKN
ncbi:4-diphosphocytidyl-2-C-methyl-D-erythritol kinase [Brevinema andersonii]|uniref:4-diphosphocytidyl-2-C-methyl-D-erythritol kinase n=1 Tax=Brevinema andersonii TaxID=34097 RepID=A0A1I1EHK6_BREAD|nr:4-(cytidine 5'-diphospho)-2-C-methyl-D-erythritol kinase [Brevinema andersonii]SFB86619.1 4-diphosphocytidyl-2-C-methyl-D-erythritol kinase [Brevinema andersonii]